MKRRTFIQTTAAALAANGCLPLLAAEKKKPAKKRPGSWRPPSRNPYVEPCAIEPITGVLPTFSPVAGAAMSGAFTAQYSLLAWQMAAERSTNTPMGSMRVTFKKGNCLLVETRDGKGTVNPSCTIKTAVTFGEGGAATAWKLESLIDGREHARLIENGSCDGKTMTVKAKSFSRQYATKNPLIHRWALLPVLASGQVKSKALVFDMLDDSALRANQTLRYEGEFEIPVKGGTAKLDSYIQTGYGVVPIHCLVDAKGQVQFITQATINWVLSRR